MNTGQEEDGEIIFLSKQDPQTQAMFFHEKMAHRTVGKLLQKFTNWLNGIITTFRSVTPQEKFLKHLWQKWCGSSQKPYEFMTGVLKITILIGLKKEMLHLHNLQPLRNSIIPSNNIYRGFSLYKELLFELLLKVIIS